MTLNVGTNLRWWELSQVVLVNSRSHYTSAGACGFAMDQVTFDLLDVHGQQPQVWEQTSDGGNVPRSCELAESPVTTVPLYY
jgi:hypothetical protein